MVFRDLCDFSTSGDFEIFSISNGGKLRPLLGPSEYYSRLKNSFGPTMGYMGAQCSKMWQNLVFNKDLSYFGNVFFQKITLEFSEGKFFIKIHDLYSAEQTKKCNF